MSELMSFIDMNKIIMIVLFVVVVVLFYINYRAINSVRVELANVPKDKDKETVSNEIKNMIVKNEERINKTDNKLEAFIKHYIQQSGRASINPQASNQIPVQTAHVSHVSKTPQKKPRREIQDEEIVEDDDEIIVDSGDDDDIIE